MTLAPASLSVVGADFKNSRGPSRRFELKICRTGEAVELRPEPKNKADRNAIGVFSCRGIQLGYLTAEKAPWIGKLMRDGRVTGALFQVATSWGALIRIGFDGVLPTVEGLPITERIESGEVEFWPDEEAPDF